MKTRQIFKDCWFMDHKDCFWIECTDKEVIEKILPINSEPHFLKKIENNIRTAGFNEDSYYNIYTSFFLITFDLKEIQSFSRYYPFSGMWNGYCPFEDIPVFEFENLDELLKLI